MRGLRNWQFEDVVAFLKDNGFIECEIGHNKKTSHHYFKRVYRDMEYLVHVQYHAGKSIPVGTMNTIVSTSGIAKTKWRGK